jgi:hypothetical protein
MDADAETFFRERLPAVGHAHHVAATELVDVEKILWRAALHQGRHLGCNVIS